MPLLGAGRIAVRDLWETASVLKTYTIWDFRHLLCNADLLYPGRRMSWLTENRNESPVIFLILKET